MKSILSRKLFTQNFPKESITRWKREKGIFERCNNHKNVGPTHQAPWQDELVQNETFTMIPKTSCNIHRKIVHLVLEHHFFFAALYCKSVTN